MVQGLEAVNGVVPASFPLTRTVAHGLSVAVSPPGPRSIARWALSS